MDEAPPLEKWKPWIIAATFSKSKTEKMLINDKYFVFMFKIAVISP